MAIGDIYKISISASGLGMQYLNTWAVYQKQSTVSDINFQQLANTLKEAIRGNQGLWYTYTTYRAVQVRGGSVSPVAGECRRTGGLVYEGVMTGTLTGGITTAEALPPQCALVMTLKSPEYGRRHRGRIYFGGLQETAQDGGLWGSALVSTLQANANALVTMHGPAGTDPTWQLGVWSERTATGCEMRGTPPHLTNVETPNLATAFTPLSSILVRPTVYTQRRRTLGVGR